MKLRKTRVRCKQCRKGTRNSVRWGTRTSGLPTAAGVLLHIYTAAAAEELLLTASRLWRSLWSLFESYKLQAHSGGGDGLAVASRVHDTDCDYCGGWFRAESARLYNITSKSTSHLQRQEEDQNQRVVLFSLTQITGMLGILCLFVTGGASAFQKNCDSDPKIESSGWRSMDAEPAD